MILRNVPREAEDASAPLTSFKRGSFYTITVDSLKYSSASSSKTDDDSHYFIINSGTSINYFPDDTAAAINALFDPPAKQNKSGDWMVQCSAGPPATVN